ncbi:MAG: DUF3368 domain-containing protein [Saprospiraceae bacterium]|nr:DUF3368 domain-containing protein [Saprospiraceae bacterium]
MVVISDTSPISNLFAIGQIDLLPQLFDKVIIPPAVAHELDQLSKFGYDLSPVKSAHWLQVNSPANWSGVGMLVKSLDKGESEAIILSYELQADFVMIDERKGRRTAQEMGVKTIGLMGILIKAKNQGLLEKIAPVLEDLTQVAGFWISDKLKEEILILAGE